MRALLFVILATACAATGGGPSSGEEDLSLELAGRTAGEARDCVSTSSGSNLVARGRQALVYERGDTIWVNRLGAACPGLRGTSQIIIEVHGNRYCRNDRFRPHEPGMSIAGPICLLGSFTPYRR